MNESKLIQSLKKWVPGDFLRLETSTMSGLPDINVCFQGKEIWIEAKMARLDGAVLLRPEQRAWALRRCRQDGRCFVVAGVTGFNTRLCAVKAWRHPCLDIVPTTLSGKCYLKIDESVHAPEIFNLPMTDPNLLSTFLFT